MPTQFSPENVTLLQPTISRAEEKLADCEEDNRDADPSLGGGFVDVCFLTLAEEKEKKGGQEEREGGGRREKVSAQEGHNTLRNTSCKNATKAAADAACIP